eukprot:8970272-Heterocapsa_arctica.AAC.1
MKLAEETWGGLWAVEAEDLPKLTRQKMTLITEDERWPHGLHPIIALIAKEVAENEGQLRPIAILPYIYR